LVVVAGVEVAVEVGWLRILNLHRRHMLTTEARH